VGGNIGKLDKTSGW